jgi:hypothetical protein
MEETINTVKCTSCWKDFRFKLELADPGPTEGTGPVRVSMLYGEPTRVGHRKDGNAVDIFGKLVEFSELVGGEWKAAQPIISHPV